MATQENQPDSGKTTQDEMRKAFEHWYSDEGQWPKAVERDSKGRYVLAGATAAWDAWQAGWKCARAETKAKEPQCASVNDLDPRHHGFQEFHPSAWGCAICGHDRACHSSAVEG